MARKAYLVDFGLRTRVIADEDATDEQIAALAVERLKGFIREEGTESVICTDNIGEIEEDTEVPYDPEDPKDNPDLHVFMLCNKRDEPLYQYGKFRYEDEARRVLVKARERNPEAGIHIIEL